MHMRGISLAAALMVLGCASPSAAFRAGTAGAVEEGLASYYARTLAGRRTASGERYDPQAMTAAHRTAPFGTWLRVRRPTGESVDVRVNDRGPHTRGRIVDLSEEAARQLDMIRAGVVRVRVEILAKRAPTNGRPRRQQATRPQRD